MTETTGDAVLFIWLILSYKTQKKETDLRWKWPEIEMKNCSVVFDLESKYLTFAASQCFEKVKIRLRVAERQICLWALWGTRQKMISEPSQFKAILWSMEMV